MGITQYLSFGFNLFVFIGIISLICGIIILFRVKYDSDKVYNKRIFNRYFGIMGIWSVLTIWCYVYAPERIFTNADHHVLEHLGFGFSQELPLVNASKPETALWDSKEGQLSLKTNDTGGFALEGQDFYAPIFKETTKGVYELGNPVFEQAIRQQLAIQWDSVAIDLHFPQQKDSLAWFQVTRLRQSYGPFKIPMAMPLRNGYSLAGLISKAQADAPGMAQVIEALDEALLVRKFYETQHPTEERNAVLLFPSKKLLDSNPVIRVDGQTVATSNHHETNISLNNNQSFYVGLWGLQNKIYTSQLKNDGNAEFLVNFPDKKYLKKLENDQESLFFTSSSQEVTKSEQLAGFYYPLFEEKNNAHHFSANLSYSMGSTQKQMLVRVINYDQNDLNGSNTQEIKAGDTLRVQSRGMIQGHNHTQWIFRIKDLKASNPLQFWHLIALIGLVVICIFISIYLTPYELQNKTEFVVYFLLLALLTLRMILLWRASTFLPVEDISANVYTQLSLLGWTSYKSTLLFVLLFFVLVWLWKWRGGQFSDWLHHKTEKRFDQFSPQLCYWFGLYLGAFLVLMGGAVIPQLERFGAVFLPLVVYFFLAFLFLQVLKRSQNNSTNQPDYQLLTRINWVLCFGYLGIADAGFSIVFLVSTLVYWLVSEVTFPKIKSLNLKQLMLLALRPTVILLGFLVLSPRIVSFIFRHTQWVIYGVAVVFLLVAGWILIKKIIFKPFGRSIHKRVSIGSLVVLSVILVGLNGKITEKLQDKGYVQYRAEVLTDTPDEIIQKEQFKFSLNRDSKLLRAAQNQWIINHFYQKSNLSLIDYFKVLPSFQQGSPYLTQISDLVTVRYVVGEHNQFIITLLIGLMLILILTATDADTRFNLFSMMRVKLLCLLFAIGLFTWMAATNRMIFLGQDFPLLSLNSVLTLLTTLGILFFAIVFGERANQHANSVQFQNEGKPLAHKVFNLVILFVIFGFPFLFERNFSGEKFNLDDTMSRLKTEFERLNTAFVSFQETDGLKKQRTQIKLGDLIQQFDKSAYSPRQNKTLFKDTSLAMGAYNSYINLLAQNNSGEHLIHVRRNNDDIYEFAVNKLFFNVVSPDANRNAWQGNLVAQEKNEQFYFLDRESGQERILDTKNADANLKQTLASLTNSSQNNNIRLTSLPAGWSLDSLPVVILSQTRGMQKENLSTFVVKNGQDIFRSAATNYAIVVKPNDVIQFIAEDSRRPTTLQFMHQSQEYLAKNVWLNGHRQFFYPLGHKFLWSYHFANLVKSKFDKYDKDAPEKHQNIALSIDPRLTEQVYDLAHDYFKNVTIGEQTDARAFNLVVLGSDGGIRALCDYKKGDKIRIDPNRMTNYREILNDLYLNVNTEQERLLFGNRCLLRMDNGPASTFKPILYGAITSQYNLGWQNLRFGGLPTVLQPDFLEPNGNDYRIRRFGGGRVKFTVGQDNLVPHDIDYYISKSTNTYNSMIAFLGSMNKAEIVQEQAYLNGTGSPQYLLRGRSDTASLNFPIFDFSGTEYRIGRLPSLGVYQNTQSLMGKGLWHNFNLAITHEQLKSREGENIQNIATDLDSVGFADSRSSNKLWSFPEASHLYMIDRNNLQNAIVQVASGADPINVTPYKMAEMAASLYSFNKRFKGSVLASHQLQHQPFDTDISWAGADNVTQFHAQNLFAAMSNTVRSGTGESLIGGVASEFGQYHFYAKTGTISGQRQGGKRDKNLMLIISREPLHGQNLTVEAMKNNHFFVLYFSFYKQANSSEWGEVAEPLRNMVRAVVNSNSFKSFMK